MTNTVKKIVYLLFAYLLGIFLYVVLHEFGHVIVILSAGGTVTEFSIVTAHVSSFGGVYNTATRLWLNANGAMFPMIAVVVYLLLYKKESKNTFYHLFSYAVPVAPICSLLAWVIVPLVYMRGEAPAGDDVTKFLQVFSQNHHPLIVSVVALLIIVAGVVIVIKKGIIKSFVSVMRTQ